MPMAAVRAQHSPGAGFGGAATAVADDVRHKVASRHAVIVAAALSAGKEVHLHDEPRGR
jgi:hypothetical protein